MGETSAGRTTVVAAATAGGVEGEARRRVAGVTAGHAVLAALLAMTAGCAFMRDPMDPRGKLDHRIANDFADAERITRGRHAFEKARARIERVQPGMTPTDVEIAMETVVVTETKGAKEDEGPRRKFVDGYLCSTDPSAVRRRWLFGYDEGGVALVGFAIEFERDNPEKEKWIVRDVDRAPRDDCPEMAE
jgi:hypothetical protein